MISGKVATQSSFSTNEPYLLERAGIAYRVFSPREGGVDFYGDNIYTTEQEIAEVYAQLGMLPSGFRPQERAKT